MNAAFSVVTARARAGEWPTPMEIGAMLHASGNVTPGEARDIVSRYAAALPFPAPSGEAGVLDALRGFTLDR